MEKELLFQHIINDYDIKEKISSSKINSFEQYPHIFRLKSNNRSFFIKQVEKNRINCEDLNVLYSDLTNITCIEKPILTKDKKYVSLFADKIILLYEELEQIEKKPDSIWWSKCLSNIHNICVNNRCMGYFQNVFYKQTIDLLNSAKKFMGPEIETKIIKLLMELDDKCLELNKNMVLCHNDPYDLNVMTINGEYRLIDTDGMGLSPKEYDIQRLMWNHLIDSNEVDNSLSFWCSFKDNYELNVIEKIDTNLLKQLYILDLIRTTSWLYIVCNDLTRKDIERQKEQLKLFERSFYNDNHAKILKKI